MERDRIYFHAVALQHEPGVIAVQTILAGGSFVVRPNLEQSRELLSELTKAIAVAEKLAAPAEAAA